MRVWLVMLLMLLLPLRGWSAAVMQVTHGPAPQVAHTQAATPAAASAHCHDTEAPTQAATAHPAETPAPPGHHQACQACDLCHGALLTQTVTPTLGMPRQVLHPIPRVTFASTVVVPHHKPPIA